jgi:hypothetical protein
MISENLTPTAPTISTTPTMAATKDVKGDNTFLKLFIVAFSMISMYYLFDKKGYIWFSWHFISMITGFVLLPGLAFVIKKAGGYTNTKNHGYLMALATLMICFGNKPERLIIAFAIIDGFFALTFSNHLMYV